MDYKERMKKEYAELKERRDKLHAINVKAQAGTLDFPLSCPIELLKEQEGIMTHYMGILEIRAEIENVSLGR